MNIREALAAEHSKRQTNAIVKYVAENPKRFAELMKVSLSNEYAPFNGHSGQSIVASKIILDLLPLTSPGCCHCSNAMMFIQEHIGIFFGCFNS